MGYRRLLFAGVWLSLLAFPTAHYPFDQSPDDSPRIDTITPARGPIAGGTRLTAIGAGFATGATGVTIDGQPVDNLEVVSPAEVRFTTRPHVNGYAGIRVTTPAGSAFREYLYVPPRVRDIPVGGITTIAGTGKYLSEGRLATEAPIFAADFAFGPDGLIYFSEPANGVIRRITTDGRLEVYAGRGADFASGDIGDGGPARTATLVFPIALTFDAQGALLIGDTFNHRIRRVDPVTRVITTIAGSGPVGSCCLPSGTGFAGDGGPATEARLNQPSSMDFDSAGNLYVLDTLNYRVRRIAPDGVITSVAGSGERGATGDNGPALAARINPWTNADNGVIRVDGQDRVVLNDILNNRIRQIDLASGLISTAVGGGTQPEGSTALQLRLASTLGLAIDRNGDYIIGDSSRLRRITTQGQVTSIFGQPQSGWSPDGTPLSAGRLTNIGRLRTDDRGRVWFLEFINKSLRRLDPATGTVTTVAGLAPEWLGQSGDPLELMVSTIGTLQASPDGGLIFGSDPRLIKLEANGTLRLLAGGDQLCPICPRGEAVPATAAGFNSNAVALGSDGSVYGAARGIKRLRPDGMVELVTQPNHGYSGDGGPASEASLDNPYGMTFDRDGNLYISDTYNHRVRRIDGRTGIISTVAGIAPPHAPDVMVPQAAGGDGGPALAATFSGPQTLAFDADGRLYVSDTGNTIRRFVVGGNIETVASSCSGPLATDALHSVHALCADGIRRIDGVGRTTLVARLGPGGMGGDGGPADSAPRGFISGMAFTADGNLAIADSGNRRIRLIRLR